MMHKAKIAVCSEIRTKHSTQREHEFFSVKTWWYVKKPLVLTSLTPLRQNCLLLTLNPYSITTDEVSQAWVECNNSHSLHLLFCLMRITVKRVATSLPSTLRAVCISAAPLFTMKSTLVLKWPFNEKPERAPTAVIMARQVQTMVRVILHNSYLTATSNKVEDKFGTVHAMKAWGVGEHRYGALPP